MITATTARRRHEQRLVELTALREQIDAEIADRQRLRARVQADIDAEVGLLARARRLAQGHRESLAGLVFDLMTRPSPPTQEGR